MRIDFLNNSNSGVQYKGKLKGVKYAPLVSRANSPAKDQFVGPQIHFGTNLTEILYHRVTRLKTIENLPCAYTGIPMIPLNVYNKEFQTGGLSRGLNDSLNLLNRFKNNLFPVERSVLDTILASPEAKKSSNLQEALNVLLPEHLNNLRVQQFEIINRMKKLSRNLPREDKQILYKSLKRAYELIKKNDIKNTFKRKTLIHGLHSSLSEAQDKALFQKIIKEADKMPASSDNIDAFIVKYSKRSSREIEQRLASPSVSTLDHMVPQALGGKSYPENAVIVSAKSNFDKQNTEFPLWFAQHKEVIQNAQKQVDFLIAKSNKQSLQDMAWYPIALKNTFASLTADEVKLNVSQLKIDKRNLALIKEISDVQPEVFGLKSKSPENVKKVLADFI